MGVLFYCLGAGVLLESAAMEKDVDISKVVLEREEVPKEKARREFKP